MKYNIQIMSRYEAILTDTKDLNDNTIIISINSINQKHHIFKNDKIIDILYLDFEDLTYKHIEYYNSKNDTSYINKTINLSQVRQIKDFVDKYKSTVNNIIVHCEMGISRSSAVGCILSKYLNGNDTYFFKTGKYIPNDLVYDIMSRGFGYNFDIKEFKSKLKLSEKQSNKNLKGYNQYGIDLNDMFGGDK